MEAQNLKDEKLQYQAQLGERLRATRESRGLSQLELQNRSGVNIWRIESGRLDPSAFTLQRIARALGVPVEELVKEE